MKYTDPGGYMVQMEFAHNHTGGGAPSAGYSPPPWPGYQGADGFGGPVHWSVFAGKTSEYDHYQAVLYSGSGTYVFDQMYGAGAWMRAQKQYDSNARYWEPLTDIVINEKNEIGVFLPPVTVFWNGNPGSGKLNGGVPKWWGDYSGNAGNGGGDWLNNAFNVNAGLGSGSGILAGNYGLTANQTFKYGFRQGGKIISASQRTAMHFSHHMKVANFLGRVNIVTGTIGVGYSSYKAISDYNEGGWSQVNSWDVSDASVGSLGVGAGVATFLVSNPVGWTVAVGIGVGVGVYFGFRFVHDLSNNW